MTTYHDTPAPQTGQVWADNDPRARGRHVLIISTHPGEPGRKPYATVTRCTPTGAVIVVNGKHRYTTNRLDRFKPTSTGYRYVTTVEVF